MYFSREYVKLCILERASADFITSGSGLSHDLTEKNRKQSKRISAVLGAIAILVTAALGITPTILTTTTTTSAFAWEEDNNSKYQAATVAEEVVKETMNNVPASDKLNNLQIDVPNVQDQNTNVAQEVKNMDQQVNEEREDNQQQYTPQHKEEYPAQEDNKNNEQESNNEEYPQREEKEEYPAEQQQHEYPARENEEYPAEEQQEEMYYPPPQERTEEYPPHNEEYPVEEQHSYPPRNEETQAQEAEREDNSIQVESNDNNNDNEGCNPNYWKNHLDSWEATRYSPDQKLSEVTDIGNAIPSRYDYTLLEALDTQNGGYDALAREFAAALLNSDHPDIQYAFSTNKVIHNFEDGADPQIFDSQEYHNDNDLQEQKNSLSDNNRAGCPL